MKGTVIRVEKKFMIVQTHSDIELVKNKFHSIAGETVEFSKRQRYHGMKHVDYKM